MTDYVLKFHHPDRTRLGGKAANLGELSKIEGVHVPDGFCISTAAFQRIVQAEWLEPLRNLKDRRDIEKVSARLRQQIEATPIPQDVADEIAGQLDANIAYAVRSSATAEDLATASFAGQLDSFLNILGKEAVLTHVRKCWASLFTTRAVTYRLQNGFDHGQVQLAVVVQEMVAPQVSGVLFTADPVSGNRKVSSLETVYGLGEALVSGRVNPDRFKVRDGKIIERECPVESEKQHWQTLTDGQILDLERLGRRIEGHFARPQDIEWCLAGEKLWVVQSRPITHLFPIPEAGDEQNRVYVSVGHAQMMTEAIKPLGLSFWLLTTRAPMRRAGGRLFVDVTQGLASPASRDNLLEVLGHGDPLVRDALTTVLKRNFIPSQPDAGAGSHAQLKSHQGMSAADILAQTGETDVAELVRRAEKSLETLKQEIRSRAGPELLDYVLEDLQELKKLLFGSLGVIKAPMDAAAWLNEKMAEWLDEKNVADTLSQSVRNNVTSEMGLAMLEVADTIRPYPQIQEYLENTRDDNFLDRLLLLEGGRVVHDAISTYLDRYGMRCPGEIDITRTRWGEKPSALLPMILSNLRNLEPGAGKRKFERGQKEAHRKEQELLERLKQLPDGLQKARETKEMIDLVRNLSGYREYPKYSMMCRYFVYKQALLKEAARLVQARLLREPEDIYYLTFEELHEAVRTQKLDGEIIRRRKDDYHFYEKLTPPRVITSEGEAITGHYHRDDLPPGALAGLPVSSGVVEGRVRVILSLAEADLEEGDILVTAFTDPSWTPVFLSIRGLITEVGGLMTHGAVIAREYGLPAVVGVQNATRLLHDGQRVRLNGTDGYVEVL